MNRLLPLLSLILSIIIFFTYSACTEIVVESKMTEKEVSSLEKQSKPEEPPIVIDAFPCDTRIEETYEFHHYDPINGKLLGLWPNPATLAWLPLLKEYYDKWGFTGTVVSFSTEHEIANDAGFSDDNILYSLPIDPSNYQIHVLTENAKHYYIDEPLEEGNYTVNQLIEVSNFIALHRPNSVLYLSSYEYNVFLYPVSDYRNIINLTSNTYIMCDWYDNEINTWDQRNVCEGFRYILGSRNPSNWIHSRRDDGEFDQLLGKANNLGINSLWLLIGNDGNTNNVDDFCYDAYNRGFLKRYYQKVTRYYRCIEHDCVTCSEAGTWILYNTIYGEIIEY